ncbi:MAG: hypothetical protein ACTSYD_02690 [Candidatus Heimdallarchaeaceae archaeon]
MPLAYKDKNYWHIILFSHKKCMPGTIRRHDVGRPGHSIRQSCVKASTGKWATQAWLLHVDDVRVVKGRKGIKTLQAKNIKTHKILQSIRSNYGRIRVVKM